MKAIKTISILVCIFSLWGSARSATLFSDNFEAPTSTTIFSDNFESPSTVIWSDNFESPATTIFSDNFESPSTVIWSDNFETDKGWTLEGSGEWERGNSTTDGTNTTNVLATDLDNTYNNNVSPISWATSPAISCVGYTRVYLIFQRLLKVSTSDSVHIEAYDGTSWIRVWSNIAISVSDASGYVTFTLDVSQQAAGNANFKVRFGIWTNSSTTNDGWNIDDFEVLGENGRGAWVLDAPYSTTGWAIGIPLESPTSGTCALATFLKTPENYLNSMSTCWATSPAISCVGYTRVYIKFKRRLYVENSTNDHVCIEASPDGVVWTKVWDHLKLSTSNDAGYITFTLDVSKQAAGNANFKVRFGMGATNVSNNYDGWNIDDFEVLGELETSNSRRAWTFSENYTNSGWAIGISTQGDASTGTCALATVLDGTYYPAMTTTYYATSPAINCVGYTRVYLRFKRLLQISSSDSVHIEVFDGTIWSRVWSNIAVSVSDASVYVTFTLDVSQYAAGNANFQMRFGMGKTSASTTYTGWNIDDFEVLGENGRGAWALDAPYSTTGWGIGIPFESPTSGTCALATFLNDPENYLDNMSTTYWATSPAINCVGYTRVYLRFQRWLQIGASDNVYIQVSPDGATWTEVWTNRVINSADGAWRTFILDVSQYAAGNANFKVRIGIGTTITSTNGDGWNIDDFEVLGENSRGTWTLDAPYATTGWAIGRPGVEGGTSGSCAMATFIGDSASGASDPKRNYYDEMINRYWVTSPVIPCTTGLPLKIYFRRWLNVGVGDTAWLQVNDATKGWENVAPYPLTANSDGMYMAEENYTIPDAYAGSNFQVRFGIGKTSSAASGVGTGWNIDDFRVEGTPPLAVEMADFSVIGGDGYNELLWQTETEIDNSKWLIMRSEQKDGEYTQIAELPAKGSLSNYQYIDSAVVPNNTYYYKLGDVSRCCGTTWHGPIEVTLKAIQYSLYLHTPKPSLFKDRVRIEYQLPGWNYNPATPISLKIYDASGRLIKVLVDEPQKPGPHTVYWDSKDDNGQPISSGSYFCYLKVDGTLTHKLIHIK
ncbi:MAG: hypothetical protein HY769_08145 [Candidatus Stahlbacteria bacterium]|nr:hypothetical protein [Candidatus Stahlbacteria bacterium]